MQRIFGLDLSRKEDRNLWYLVVEIFWAAILGAAANFNAAYAIRLGASNTDIGLLSSLPALIAVVISIPAGRFLESRTSRKPWLMAALFIARFTTILMAIVPFVHIPGISQGFIVVILMILSVIPAHFFNIGFTALLADIIPSDRRAAIFSARNITVSAASTVVIFLYGLWLKNFSHFPNNYQIMYVFGFTVALLSNYFLLKIDVPNSKVKPPETGPQKTLWSNLTGLVEAIKSQPSFFRITRNTFLHGIGLWVAVPLYSLLFVKDLGASDAWLGWQGTIASGVTILGYAFWRWVIVRWSEARTLKTLIVTMGLYPLLVGLFPNLTVILIAAGVNSFLAAGVNLSHFNTLLSSIPEESRPTYTAYYFMIANIGAFISPWIGLELASIFGKAPVLIFCGLLSIIGSSSFIFWPVKALPPPPLPKITIRK
jgi:MFS family permease